MITRIDVDSENAFFLPILGVTPKDSLLIRSITGLSPPDTNLFIGDYARDGGTYQGRRVGSRNVVITFDLNPNPALGQTIDGLRAMLYKAFLDPLVTADYVKLKFHDDAGRIRIVVGYTEKFETELFDSETTCQISIICPDPYIRDNVKTVLTNPVGWTTVPFSYEGTAKTGFEVEILITASTPTLTIDNNGRTMVMTRSFIAGDVVNINTNRESRLLTVTPSGGTAQPLIAGLSPLSPWLELHSQSNVLKVYGTLPTDIIAAAKSLEYTQSYWGL